MKTLLLLLSLLLSFNIHAKSISSPINESELDDKIQKNLIFINKLNNLFMKNSINIYYIQWQRTVDKKCNWVKVNIDKNNYGKNDRFSDKLCILTEQNAYINELITISEQQNINFMPQEELNSHRSELVAKKSDNVYFNYLSDNFSNKFCHTFYQMKNKIDCMNRFLFYQYIPNSYNIKITQKQANLFSQPLTTEKVKEYLHKGQKVTLLTRKNDFYYIEYKLPNKKIMNQWLHCSSIDAC